MAGVYLSTLEGSVKGGGGGREERGGRGATVPKKLSSSCWEPEFPVSCVPSLPPPATEGESRESDRDVNLGGSLPLTVVVAILLVAVVMALVVVMLVAMEAVVVTI